MRFFKMALCLPVVALSLFSCEEEAEQPKIDANNLKGMFVVCEGNFSSTMGDITYYHPDSLSAVNRLYYSVNGSDAGSVVSAFAVVDTLGFMVVNNSQQVIVVNMKTFKKVKTIEGFSYPRNVVKASANTVYISNGNGYGKSYVYAISLSTLSKVDSIEVGAGPEKMVLVDNKMYVANSGGYTNNDSTVSVIDVASFTVSNTITVGKIPTDLVVDANKNVWAYCKGVPDYSNYPDVVYAKSALCKIKSSNGNVTSFPFASITAQGINNLAIDKNGKTLFYITDAVYKMGIDDTQLPSSKFVDVAFYGIDVDPKSGNVIGLNEVDKKAQIYSATGAVVSDFATGDYPNGVVFYW